jgi:hypothetical protein
MQSTNKRLNKAPKYLDETKENTSEALLLISFLFRLLVAVAQRTLSSWLERNPNAACLINVLYILCYFAYKFYLSRNRNAEKKDDEESIIGLFNSPTWKPFE